MTTQDFIAAISGPAKASAAITRIPASFTVAEAALESGWGSSQLALQGKNLFGVKADPAWQGETLLMNTREFLHGAWVMVPAKWRKYIDWLGGITDHAAFLTQNARYKACF
ncbi:MAG: glycoside hydrolase family 73 protein, partial [Stenotrophobium sp.]